MDQAKISLAGMSWAYFRRDVKRVREMIDYSVASRHDMPNVLIDIADVGILCVRDGQLFNMISMPTACPFCRSNRLVTGKLAGGIEESAAYIVLAGVSISFWKAEIWGIVNAVKVEKHVVLCLACGMAWAKADIRSALRLIEGHGSGELKRITLAGGCPDAQPRSDEFLQCRPEPDAAPNGGPATQLGNSGGAERPPSVS